MWTQIICTFVFVSVILMVKGISAKNPLSKDGAAGALAVMATLYGMIWVGMNAGPCFNPAVGIAFSIIELWQTTNPNNAYTHYLYAYTLGPAIGGIIAGAWSIAMKKMEIEPHNRDTKTERSTVN